MKKYFLVYFLFACILSIKAQGPTWEWVRTAKGNSVGSSVAAGPSTNVYCTGSMGDSIKISNTILTSQYNYSSFYLSKYKANGSLIWAKKPSPYGNISVKSMAIDASENIFLLGTYRSLAYMDTFTLGSYSNNGTDIVYLAKLDSSGKTLWVRTCGGNYYCNPEYVTVDSNGEPIICGIFQGDSISFNQIIIHNSDILTHSPGIFVAKYNTNGNALWAHHYGGNNNANDNVPTGLTCDASNNIYISGWFSSATLTFPTTTLTNSNAGNLDIFLAKLTPSGNFVWAKGWGGIGWDEGMAVGVDAAGYVYLAGDFESSSINFGSSVITNTNSSQWWGTALFVSKFDAAGNNIWAKSKNLCQVQSMGIDPLGNTYISGFMRDSATFGSNKLYGNFYLGIYDSNGSDVFGKDIKMKKAINGNNFVRSMYVSPKVNGAVYVTGGFDCKKIYPDTCTASNSDTTGYKSALLLVRTNTAIVGIKELTNENKLIIYPNPSNGKFNISIANQSFNFELYNSLGQKISPPYLIDEDEIEIDLSNYSPGIYFVKVGTMNRKLIKE